MVTADHLMLAHRFINDVIDDADMGGPHHAPCFRDCLGDNRMWVEQKLAEFIHTLMLEQKT